jgi:ubiquinone/menaquinone biosynthesis C-methylase UbiE
MERAGFDPGKYTASSREAWDSVAEGFARDHAHRLEPYGHRLLEMLEIDLLGQGARVLDLCSGPGEPAIAIASRLRDRAQVVGSDFSPAMVAAASRRAEELGLANLEFREADAQQLPFGKEQFDLVTCRFGLMLVGEPDRAAREVERVLKKGGRFGFTTWSPPREHAALSIVRSVVKDLVPAEALPPMPDIYQLGEPARVTALLDQAEMAARKFETLDSPWSFASPSHYWESMTHGNPMERMLSKLPHEMVAAIKAETLRRVSLAAATNGSLSLGCEALLVVAQKGMT